MSARQARWEVVQTGDGWHARFRSSNGRIIMSSESYTDSRAAWNAIRVVESAVGASGQPLELRELDERTAATS